MVQIGAKDNESLEATTGWRRKSKSLLCAMEEVGSLTAWWTAGYMKDVHLKSVYYRRTRFNCDNLIFGMWICFEASKY